MMKKQHDQQNNVLLSMNLLLLQPNDLIDAHTAVINDARLWHIQQVHKAKQGDSIRVGLINDKMGTGYINKLTDSYVEVRFELNQLPPAKLPITLLLALPRPKMLKRILQTIASMGISKLILINSYRVEKSFWQTPLLTAQNIQTQLILGLEQARDTQLPEVILEKRFKPFVEDKLPYLTKGTLGLVAHPGNYPICPTHCQYPITLAIGPEGGWIEYEMDKLQQAGLTPIQLGTRILKVETALVALLTKIAY